MNISVLDTTLRDGAQGSGVYFSVADKLGIVLLLDNLGIQYIEAGNPGSNPKDREFFTKVKEIKLNNAKIVAFGATRKKNISANQDPGLYSLIQADTEYVSIVGKSSVFQVEHVLKTTKQQNLAMIEDTIKYLKSFGKKVFFDAEHFYDGYNDDKDYAIESLKVAKDAGADMLVLCDTRGACFPSDAYQTTKKIVDMFDDIEVSAHFHNDIGCAVANTVEAVRAGAKNIQGTFLGIGERTGNASLAVTIPNLQLKLGFDVLPPESLRYFTRTAIHIAELSNMVVEANQPYIGSSAFSHKAGMHIDGVAKNNLSFEHIDPTEVGNKRNILLSEMSGKAAILEKIIGMEQDVPTDNETVDRLVERLKRQEQNGHQYEFASASFNVMVLKELGMLEEFFKLVSYTIVGERTESDGRRKSLAVVKISVGDKQEICAREGDGPVHALDRSLRGALETFYPAVAQTKLVDYRVRVINPEDATASRVRVIIETAGDNERWSTLGVSADIIDASFKAITDSVLYYLHSNKFNKEVL